MSDSTAKYFKTIWKERHGWNAYYSDLFFSELLKIMDEAEHLAEARALMKPGASKEAGGDGNGGEKEGNKFKNQKPSPAEGLVPQEGSVSQHEGDKEDHKPSPSEEGNVEELHNLQMAMK